ncbi:pyridoxamine 5'-phosphate oxidase family protein [Pseudaminobacter sp. 19-2017]|uniref:Pyridoxamine 5'-phosphate oxidase family protein n=1 Tax=Pseudaminobacter soli (ex Zhang et al. 2022) TaxID=2831468 RepID=A0A942IA93_9HYPH|nr:pyridoxamine 5'-phosphate oxidase family protein [Pseudaminobacter soli]MBS3650226.1 pyridoxamine 5'-phosphate oxidase family protein [Pseudaminobacter soli]
MWVRSLSSPECRKLLEANRLGRLACSSDGRPYLVPIYYAYGGNYLYAFSLPGRKIEYLRANPAVAMLVELSGPGRAWQSVLVEGRFEELRDRIGYKVEREHAWSLLSQHANWWEPGALKPDAQPVSNQSPHVFFRISIDQLSGREAKER